MPDDILPPTPTPFPEVLRQFRENPRALLGRIPGIWPVDKPSGPTSHDLVARARRAWKLRRVGHAGTLDPMAEGVLILLADNATRLFDEFQGFPKTYRATLRWGIRTDTCDRTGAPLADWRPERSAPPEPEAVRAALAAFRGDILQTPPMYSAIKRGGQPLHRLARKGMEVEREARPAKVYDLEWVEPAAPPEGGAERETAELLMTVGSGFYVRTLIDDLGLALGVGATMTRLVREAIGPFTRADALAVETVAGR